MSLIFYDGHETDGVVKIINAESKQVLRKFQFAQFFEYCRLRRVDKKGKMKEKLPSERNVCKVCMW